MPINKINNVVLHEDLKKTIDDKATKTYVDTMKSEIENSMNDIYSNLVRKESVPTFSDIAISYPNPREGGRFQLMIRT